MAVNGIIPVYLESAYNEQKARNKMAYDPDRLMNKIQECFPDDDHKCQFIATLLGTSGTFAEWIARNVSLNDLPDTIKYNLLLTSINMISVLSDKEPFAKIDIEDISSFRLSEQDQENCYRKMRYIIDQIQENLKQYEV